MKKVLSLCVIIIAVLCSFSLISSAKVVSLEKNFVKEGEFTLISYQGLTGYLKEDKLDTFEDTVWNLLNMKDSINLKHVTFMGPFTQGSTYTYWDLVRKQGKTIDELYSVCLNDDTTWLEQYEALAEIASILDEGEIPYGVNYSFTDYPSTDTGLYIKRDNHKTKYFNLIDTVLDGVEYGYRNDSNFYITVENNGVNYMIFQLETWPSSTTLDWFNETLKENQDKYAIVYLPSFTDSTGNMYTMWDRSLKGAELNNSKTLASTYLKNVNLQNVDEPRDGDGIWDYSFSKFDNVLAIVSCNAKTDKIVITKGTNSRGCETAFITANATELIKSMGPLHLALKISADNKTISARYLVPFEGYIDTSDTSITLEKIGTLAEPEKVIPKIETQYNGANKAYILGYDGNVFKPQNNMRRSEACTIFARLILGTQDIPAGYTTRFTDVGEGEWYYNAVAFLDESGFFEHLTSNTYDPQGYITRAEFVDLANKASSLVVDKNVDFTDVDENHFYYESIMASAGSGLVGGYPDGTFKPDKTITRAEVVTVLNRLLGISATEKNISPDRLSNKFSDIDSHWARLDILMASNSNVHGEYYYEASLDGIIESDSAYIFRNKRFEFVIDKSTARVTSFKNLDNGKEINSNSLNPYFIYQNKLDGARVLSNGITTEGNRLCFEFKNGSKVYMLVEILDDYMTFEIDSVLAPGMASVTFANFTLDYSTDDYRFNGMGMAASCEPQNNAPYGIYTTLACTAYSYFSDKAIGAKYGISFCKSEDALEICQKVSDAVDTSVGLASRAGGAYAKDWKNNYGDYIIYSDIRPEILDDLIEFCKRYGVEQIDIHMTNTQDGNSFLQGTFDWIHFDSHEDFYENFGKKLHENGIIYGLHSYSNYISYDAEELLTNPRWQKQLQMNPDTYTVRNSVTERSSNIATEEDVSGFDTTTAYAVVNSKYILIDEEIISVGQGTSSGFTKCLRGCFGTTPSRHVKGAKIYHLSGHYSQLIPTLGSELFYEVADRMADAYNRAGFDMLYFDAIDGINNQATTYNYPTGSANYYHQMFIHRVVSQCERTPVVESAGGAKQELNVRGRVGARDSSIRALKATVTSHTELNSEKFDNNVVGTLGWFNFYPDQNPTLQMTNTLQKAIFHDDIDLLGLHSIVYDQTMVHDNIPNEKESLHEQAIEYFSKYAALRKSDYFTQATKDKLVEMGGEFKLVEKEPGEYAFLQMYYNKANVGNITGESFYSFEITNPYTAQTPFVRVESRWSTDYSNEMLLVEFDENLSLSSQNLHKTGFTHDLRENAVLKFKVFGTGRDGDAILISLMGAGSSRGRIDYFIDLNFNGWREFTMLDADNSEYDLEKYTFPDISYFAATAETARHTPTYNAISEVTIRLCGNSAGNAKISSIYAYKQDIAPVENPTVTIGSSSITFNTVVNGGDYVEYEPDTNKAYLYSTSKQTKTEIPFTGELLAPEGKSKVKYSATATTESVVRAKVVLGFAGQTIENIK